MFVYTKYSKCEYITSYKAYKLRTREGARNQGFITDNYGRATFIAVGNPSHHLDYKGQFELVSEDQVVGGVVVLESHRSSQRYVYTDYDKCDYITPFKLYNFEDGWITTDVGLKALVMTDEACCHLDCKGKFTIVTNEITSNGYVVRSDDRVVASKFKTQQVYTKYEGCSYITPYKVYDVEMDFDGTDFGLIFDNDGDEIYTSINRCTPHLYNEGEFIILTNEIVVDGYVVMGNQVEDSHPPAGSEDDMPPAPTDVEYRGTTGEEMRVIIGASGLVGIGIKSRDGLEAIALEPDDVLELAADLTRMALAIKRKYADEQ